MERKTWKGHGNPARLLFGGFTVEAAEPVEAMVTVARAGLLRLTLANGRVRECGVASKFWAAPVMADEPEVTASVPTPTPGDVPELPAVVIPGHHWRWFNPQGGQPIDYHTVQLMRDGDSLSPVALIIRNGDGTWRAERGSRWGISGILAGGWQRALTMTECAEAIAVEATRREAEPDRPMITGHDASSHSRRGDECRICGQPVAGHARPDVTESGTVAYWVGTVYGLTEVPGRAAQVEAWQAEARAAVEVTEAPRPVGNAKTGAYKLTDRMTRALVATVRHSPSGVMVSCPGNVGNALVKRGLASKEAYHFVITDEGRAEAAWIMKRKAELSAESAESDAKLARDLAAIAERAEVPAIPACITRVSDYVGHWRGEAWLSHHMYGVQAHRSMADAVRWCEGRVDLRPAISGDDVAGLQVSAEVYVSEHGHGVAVRKLGSKRKPSKRHGGRRGGRR